MVENGFKVILCPKTLVIILIHWEILSHSIGMQQQIDGKFSDHRIKVMIGKNISFGIKHHRLNLLSVSPNGYYFTSAENGGL